MTAERFHALFKGLDRVHGTFEITGTDAAKKKKVGKARTEKGPPTVELWEKHLSGERGLGVTPITDSGAVFFGCIDIDDPEIDHAAVESKAIALGLPVIVCKSKSNGAHVYFFADDAGIPAYKVRAKLVEWCSALGYPKTTEVFPKQDKLEKGDVGNWLNMPYFGGDSRVAVIDGREVDADTFLDYAYALRKSEKALDAIALLDDELADGPPCLQTLCREGFPEGTRNEGLFNLGVFARMKHPDDWEDRLDDLNARYMSPPLRSREVIAVAKSVGKKAYFYKCDNQPLCNHCNKALCKTREYGVGTGNSEGAKLPDLNNLRRLNTDPPRWLIDVNAKTLEVTTNELLDARLFRIKSVDSLQEPIPTVKQVEWEWLINPMIKEAEVIDAPEDAGVFGQFKVLLVAFLTAGSIAETRDEIVMGVPWIDENDLAHFRSTDLLAFLKRNGFGDYKTNEVYSKLKDMGAGAVQLRIQQHPVRVWTIPMTAVRALELPDHIDRPDLPGEEF